MDAITVTKQQIENYVASWEQDFRDGKTLSIKENNKRTVAEIAAASADAMWLALTSPPESKR